MKLKKEITKVLLLKGFTGQVQSKFPVYSTPRAAVSSGYCKFQLKISISNFSHWLQV